MHLTRLTGACVVGLMIFLTMKTAAMDTPPATAWPADTETIDQAHIILPEGKKVSLRDSGWFDVSDDGVISIRPDAPNGDYIVEWNMPRPENVVGITASARLYKSSATQRAALKLTDGTYWSVAGEIATEAQWNEAQSTVLMFQREFPIAVRWEFNKQDEGETGQAKLADLKLAVATDAQLDQAVADFRKPLAEGLPPLLDPRTARKPWTGRLELKDGMMLKDGEPFFPIGYVFGSDDRALAQAAAMGCTAVHVDVGWWISPAPGPIDPKHVDDYIAEIRRAADWGVVTFPLLTGHYVPGWFRDLHPVEQAMPLGSDGKQTGSWFVYSIHYPPFREQIVHFWKAATPRMAAEPSVMGINFWNEPAYGGPWNQGSQFADYTQWGIDNYRQHLRKKYNDNLETLRASHGQAYESFEALQPPRKPDELGPVAWLDWMEFGQHYFADFFQWEREIIRSVAPDARLVNKKQTNPWDRSTASSGTNWHLMSQSEDIFGLNIYEGSVSGSRNKLDAARSYAHGKPVVIFETNAMPPNAAARTPDRVRCQLWGQILGGARGMFIFALIDNEEHGLLNDVAVSKEARPEYVRLTQTVSKHQRQLASPFVPARVAVLYSTTAALQYTGDRVPEQVMAAMELLRNSHYQADILPEERCTAEGLAEYDVIVLPTWCILKQPERDALSAFAERGGKIIAFAKSLATDEYLRPIDPPTLLGMEQREIAIGDRVNQRISQVSPELEPFLDGEAQIKGVELISAIKNADALIPGAKVQAEQGGKVLAYNSDSYPTIVASPNGNVVYCAFETGSTEIRGLIEGILRTQLDVKQEVRVQRDGKTEGGVMTSLRQDYKDPNRRYLLAMNTLFQPVTVTVMLEEGWTVEKEDFHNQQISPGQGGLPSVQLAPREIFLFELTRAASAP